MQRTATMDQVCQRVPVDAVGKHVGEYQRKPQLVELFDTPRSHEAPLDLLPVELLGCDQQWFQHVSLQSLGRHRVLRVPAATKDRLDAVVADGAVEPW